MSGYHKKSQSIVVYTNHRMQSIAEIILELYQSTSNREAKDRLRPLFPDSSEVSSFPILFCVSSHDSNKTAYLNSLYSALLEIQPSHVMRIEIFSRRKEKNCDVLICSYRDYLADRKRRKNNRLGRLPPHRAVMFFDSIEYLNAIIEDSATVVSLSPLFFYIKRIGRLEGVNQKTKSDLKNIWNILLQEYEALLTRKNDVIWQVSPTENQRLDKLKSTLGRFLEITEEKIRNAVGMHLLQLHEKTKNLLMVLQNIEISDYMMLSGKGGRRKLTWIHSDISGMVKETLESVSLPTYLLRADWSSRCSAFFIQKVSCGKFQKKEMHYKMGDDPRILVPLEFSERQPLYKEESPLIAEWMIRTADKQDGTTVLISPYWNWVSDIKNELIRTGHKNYADTVFAQSELSSAPWVVDCILLPVLSIYPSKKLFYISRFGHENPLKYKQKNLLMSDFYRNYNLQECCGYFKIHKNLKVICLDSRVEK